jgi:hypothetical protein
VDFFVQFSYFPALLVLMCALSPGPDERLQPAPSATRAVASLLPLLARVYIAWAQKLYFPGRTFKDGDWQVNKLLGSYVYLTRHCGTLQLVHAAFSCLVELSLAGFVPGWLGGGVGGRLAPGSDLIGELVAASYTSAVFVGGLSSFVTVQFYQLVYSDASHDAYCALWEKRGWNVRWLDHVVHRPPIVLAAVDILVVKDRAALLDHVPGAAPLAGAVAAYALCYLVLVHVNRSVTGQWPYALLERVDEGGLTGWAKFYVIQVATLCVFVCSMWCLAVFCCAPALWDGP